MHASVGGWCAGVLPSRRDNWRCARTVRKRPQNCRFAVAYVRLKGLCAFGSGLHGQPSLHLALHGFSRPHYQWPLTLLGVDWLASPPQRRGTGRLGPANAIAIAGVRAAVPACASFFCHKEEGPPPPPLAPLRPPDQSDHRGKSPRREVVRSSAGAGVVYPPLFWDRLRSMPQGMTLDVQPL